MPWDRYSGPERHPAPTKVFNRPFLFLPRTTHGVEHREKNSGVLRPPLTETDSTWAAQGTSLGSFSSASSLFLPSQAPFFLFVSQPSFLTPEPTIVSSHTPSHSVCPIAGGYLLPRYTHGAWNQMEIAHKTDRLPDPVG